MIQADYSSTLKELADVKRNAPHNRAGVPIAPANLLTRFAFGTDPLLERKPAVELKHKRESAREREDEREGKRDSAATPSTSTDAGAPLAILPDQTTTTDPHEAAGCDRAGTSCPPIQRTGRIVMALPAHTAPDARRVNDADHAAATDGGMPDCSTADRAAPLPADTVPVREGAVLATALRYGLLLVGCRAQGRPQSKLTHGVTMVRVLCCAVLCCAVLCCVWFLLLVWMQRLSCRCSCSVFICASSPPRLEPSSPLWSLGSSLLTRVR